jgi:hypothetical protein
MCIPNHPSFFLTSSERETPFNLQHSPSPSALSYFLPDSSQSPASSVSSDNLAVSSDTPPPFYPGEPSLVYPNFNDSEEKINSRHAKSPRVNIAHPYARLYAKKEGTKRRKIWNHALEKSLFSPHELLVFMPLCYVKYQLHIPARPWEPPTVVRYILPV